jgi:inner membrane protein
LDPVTHTFVGASLSAAGLRRTTPLATATLMVAANAPDVDIAAQAWGSWTALAFRRGLTHGVPALFVLPFLVTGGVVAWDRWIRRRRRPDAPSVRPGAVLALSTLGVWTHPFLDWLNNYGMRWLMPLDPSWSYGDALFIIDPWVWLLLGGSLFLVYSASLWGGVLWALLAVVMSVLVLGSGLAPRPVQLLWMAGLAGWILLRMRFGGRSRVQAGEVASRWALGGVAVYILAMVIQTPLSERVVQAQALELGLDPIYDVMVAPVPALPHRGQVVVVTPEAYHRGAFSWTGSPGLVLEGPPLERDFGDPVVAAAREHPDARSFLVWSRYPWYQVHPDGDGWRVEIRDVRYLGRGDAGGLMGLTVYVDRNLELR